MLVFILLVQYLVIAFYLRYLDRRDLKKGNANEMINAFGRGIIYFPIVNVFILLIYLCGHIADKVSNTKLWAWLTNKDLIND